MTTSTAKHLNLILFMYLCLYSTDGLELHGSYTMYLYDKSSVKYFTILSTERGSYYCFSAFFSRKILFQISNNVPKLSRLTLKNTRTRLPVVIYLKLFSKFLTVLLKKIMKKTTTRRFRTEILQHAKIRNVVLLCITYMRVKFV